MSPAGSALLRGWPFRVLLLIVLASAAGYLAFSLWAGWRGVAHGISQVGLAGSALALALSLINYGVRFLRWQKYLALLGHPVPWRPGLRIYLAGFGLTIVPGKAGETIRSVFLKAHGVPFPESLAALFSEHFSNLISMAMLAAFGLWLYPAAQNGVALLALFIVLGLALLQNTRWLQALKRLARTRLPRKPARLVGGLLDVVLHSRRCFRLPVLLLGIVLGLVAWRAEGLALYYILHALGGDIPLRTALFIYAFSMLLGAVSFLPGGLGGAEVTMVALLVINHMAQPDAVAATLLIRLATLWFAVALGIAALALPSGRRAG